MTQTLKKSDRKLCEWPGCRIDIHASRRFCQDRKCQVSRFHVRLFGGEPEQDEAIRNKTEHDQAQVKKWRQNQRTYIRNWKRGKRRKFTQAERRVLLENAKIRARADGEAYAEADAELRRLIEEQRADGDYSRRAKGDPWLMASLDALVFEDEDMYEHLGGDLGVWRRGQLEYADPTFDAARPELEQWLWELRESQGDVLQPQQ